MRGTGNDYLYFDCFDQTVESPESLAVRLSNRRTGVGSRRYCADYALDHR